MARTTIHRLLSRLWYPAAQEEAVADALRDRRTHVRCKGGAAEWVYRDSGSARGAARGRLALIEPGAYVATVSSYGEFGTLDFLLRSCANQTRSRPRS